MVDAPIPGLIAIKGGPARPAQMAHTASSASAGAQKAAGCTQTEQGQCKHACNWVTSQLLTTPRFSAAAASAHAQPHCVAWPAAAGHVMIVGCLLLGTLPLLHNKPAAV
jgi:hypothetical protein